MSRRTKGTGFHLRIAFFPIRGVWSRPGKRSYPENAIRYGFRYFAGLMRDHQGDMSLALASYNAGPHRVKTYRGIPPFSETVGFRNRILKYYQDYRDRLE